MTEIVERLRARAKLDTCTSHDTMTEAADTIEMLVSRLHYLEEERLRLLKDRRDAETISQGWESRFHAVAAENKRLRDEVVRQAHLIIELGAKLHVAKEQSAEQFERNELGGKTLNEFLEGKP